MQNPSRRFIWIVLCLLLAALACNLPAREALAPAASPSPAAAAVEASQPPPTDPPAASTPPPAAADTAQPSATLAPATPTAIILPSETPMPTATPWPSPTGQQLARPNGSVVATYLSQPPLIDGNVGEWSLGMFIVDSITFGPQNWRDVRDLSGSVMLGWDESYLYIAARVLDDVYVQNAAGNHLYEGDSVEILLDADLAGDFYTNSLNADDFQLGLSPGLPTIGEGMQAYLWYPEALSGYQNQVTIAAQKNDLGYDLEAAIPWSVFGVTPQPWKHYGFCFSISDNDKADGIVQQSLASNVPSRHLTMPATWGDLLLSR